MLLKKAKEDGMADASIGAQSRDELMKIVVRLLEITDRCEINATKYELMLLADSLAAIIDEIEE